MEKNRSFSLSFKNGASLGHWSARFDEPDDVHQNEMINLKERLLFYFRLRFIFAAEIEDEFRDQKRKNTKKKCL